MEETIRDQFNQLLIRHYERLTGSKNAAGGLPLNLDNIGCFILFGGRELEMADYTSDVSERYTMAEFLAEIKDAGIPDDEHFQATLRELAEKKYIDHRPDGHIYGYMDCKETARILNRILPKMQGISLLAYIWQTIAEVLSGRTDLKSALSRFDQTLSNHGVVPPKPKIPVITSSPKQRPEPPREERKEYGINRRGSRIIRDYVISETPVKAAPVVEEPEFSATCEEIVRDAEPSKEEVSVEASEDSPAVEQKIAEQERAIADVEKEKQAVSQEVAVSVAAEEPSEISAESNAEENDQGDDEIARKIAAFEKELALVCPVCKTGILQEKATAAGKMFYACESKTCNFISWGKPHNIPCVRCKNPFLIEVTDTAGQIILRCPRATCQHRQALHPQGVKVVRKRLVRRKK